ncbi:AEC family transporter [Pseudooceanicola sediminis]|uniref:AEC family transporter n=1 Tax=Pseudooceanicola sediminis TaxID=2211117 RepID=A0A399J3I1_9RHOB|nr:AEC family transporter [Pseudooceanicola sediminis]KAA2312507.1 AEC family transporter [Puniceibacterium sp. HSS470]RII37516.1 AEC family transporter [Pseudooceanicola sediminis]
MLFFTIWPLFAMICLGFILARSRFPSEAFWPAAERFNYFVLFPALLVSSLVAAPLRDPAILRLGGAAVATVLLASAGLVVLRRLRPVPAARFGPALQGVVRFNTYLGLAVTATLAGPEGLGRAAVVLAVLVPLVNVLSIIALSERSEGQSATLLIRTILRNPLILACIAGMTLALSGIGLPFGSDRLVKLLAQGSLPLGLLCVGAALQPAALRREVTALAGNSALRLLAMPVLGAVIGGLFGLNGVEALVLVIFCAIPTAPTAYVLTRQMNGDGTLMAGIVTAQTLAAVVTIPVVLMLFGYR